MEPVPETERMDEFRETPVPTLRLFVTSQHSSPGLDEDGQGASKPPCMRRATEPTTSSPQSPGYSPTTLPYRPRNISPFSRGHMRSRSTASTLAPPMSRAQSMPVVNSSGHLYQSSMQRSSSPVGSPSRYRTPRKPIDDVFPGLSSRTQSFGDSVEAISEEDETSYAHERSQSPTGLMPNNTFPRRRRPASPLRNIALIQYPMSGGPTQHSTSPITSSPSYQSNKFNDSVSGSYNCPGSSTSSSVPSTPNSIRSRSPSISSLETIPDIPDAEEAALEAERIAQLKAAAEAEEGDEATQEAKRSGSLDSGWRGRTLGTTFGTRDKRKRWSVCGAERRGDLDLETIWED